MSLMRYTAALATPQILEPESGQIVLTGNIPLFGDVVHLLPSSGSILITGNAPTEVLLTGGLRVQIFIGL